MLNFLMFIKVQLEFKSRFFRRGEILVVFGPWDFQNSQKEVSENFESVTTFAFLIEIYLPCQFHKFPLSHSFQTPESEGGPRKMNLFFAFLPELKGTLNSNHNL
jgi:hypothetical protein